MRIPAFFLSFLSLVILGLFILTPYQPSYAQQLAPSSNPFAEPSTESDVPQNLHTLSQGLVIDVLAAVGCQLTGYDFASQSHLCLGYNTQTGKLSYAHHDTGLAGYISNGIAITMMPPGIHTVDYVAYLQQSFGFPKHAYASGFDQLQPLQKIWLAFRNVSYLLFVVVFIIIGFAIMIRAKIDPRTVMTIENQIPKIIVALLLVTFSYAIAGLVIDLLWVSVYVVINLFASIDPNLHAGVLFQNTTATPFDFTNAVGGRDLGLLTLIGNMADSVRTIAFPLVKNMFDTIPVIGGVLGFLPCLIGALGTWHNFLPDFSTFGTCMETSGAQAVGMIAGGVAYIIFAVAMVVALARLWFSILKAYSLFLIYTILAPFFIMMGVLPGSKVNFENWLRHIIAYLFVSPTAITLLLLGKMIADAYGSAGTSNFVPPLLGATSGPSSGAIGSLIAFAIILLLPQSLQMVQDALAAPDMKYLAGVGQMFGVGSQAVTSFSSGTWKRLTRHEDRMNGLNEGILRKIALGKPGSWQRRWIVGEKGGK